MYTTTVSIVIPFTKMNTIKTVLQKLMAQTYPLNLIEFIVVGVGSSELTAGWSIKAVETEAIYNPGRARNIGASKAKNEFLLFLDDDCEPAQDWVEQNVYALQEGEVAAVGGQIRGKSQSFFARCVDFSHFGFSQGSKPKEILICSASLGVRRALFEEMQGFNEHLRSEEDMEFCYRLLRKGYKTLYQPAIKVIHDHRRTSLITLLRYSYFYGRVSGLYVKRLYPTLSKRNELLTKIQHPVIYLLVIAPVALAATINIVRANVQEQPYVLLCAPFIFLAKVASHIGIWQWLIHEEHND